jgi:plasmid stability protein
VARLIVRSLPARLVREPGRRAARNGRSSGAEHRAILEEVLRAPPSGPMLKELLLAMPVGDDADLARIGGGMRPADS